MSLQTSPWRPHPGPVGELVCSQQPQVEGSVSSLAFPDAWKLLDCALLGKI